MNKQGLKTILCVLSSSLLFYLAFPNIFCEYGFWVAGWIFSIPLIFILDDKPLKDRLIIGILFGFLSYFFIVNWLVPLTIWGMAVFVICLSIQPVLFCILYPFHGKSSLLRVIYIPALWVSSEYIRTLILGGFTWTLGYSQSFNTPCIQIADITGSYGISFIVILISYSFYQVIRRQARGLHSMTIIIFLCLIMGYGYISMNDRNTNEKPVKISIIQGNIDQHKKWNKAFVNEVIGQYTSLTKEVLFQSPDLIIWPETSFPGDYYEDQDICEMVEQLAQQVSIPILFGAPFTENGKVFNSALLMDSDGTLIARYRKIYLVPFCEYFPFQETLSFLMSGCHYRIGDFSAGNEISLFPIRSQYFKSEQMPQKFGVVICSEDLFSGLVRKEVDKGAGFVVNITNDALLGNTAAPYVHAQASIMRAVENRIPFIRCTNTGWSCFISKYGEIIDSVEESGKKLFIKGHATQDIFPGIKKTFYNNMGDIFSLCCVICCIIFITYSRQKTRF